MTRRTSWILLLVVVVALLVGGWYWRSKQAPAAAPAGPAAASPSASSPPVVLDLGPGDILTLGRTELLRTLTVSGGLKAVNSAMVKAKVAGELQRLSVREGDTVTAGQVIGQIDAVDNQSRLRQAQESALAAKAQLDIAERSLANNQALVDQNFISRTALDTSIANANAARATLRSAQAAVEVATKAVGDAVLKAPISGVIAQRLVQPGERVALDARLVEVVDLSRLELEAAVAPEDVIELRVGQAAQLHVDGLASPLQATVARINPSTQAGTRAVMAYLGLPGQAGLRQGLFANGRIELARAQVLAVPLTLVRVDQPQPYVLALEGGKVVQRTVALGQRGEAVFEAGAPATAAVELTQGVREGDTLLRGLVGAVRAGTPARLSGR